MTETVAVRAEALFVSELQSSESPSAGQIRRAVAEALTRLGRAGCAARVAQEFGEHPIDAARRMRWVLAAVPAAFARG